VDLGKRYRLSANAKLREERWGGVIYCHKTQRLFLVISLLMPFLEADGTETAGEIAHRLQHEGCLPISALGKVAEGLERLAIAGVINEL
jgi:putative mycofactocin binding protein MftB